MDRNSLYELVHKYRAKGFKQTQIADLLSITQARVSQILQHASDQLPKWGGHRVSKLSSHQKALLTDYLDRGASHFGFEGDFWDSKRVKQLILEQFGVNYHPDYMPAFLRSIGYSQQKPQVIDNRQDLQKIETYLQETLPALKKSRTRR
jgi:transposase